MELLLIIVTVLDPKGHFSGENMLPTETSLFLQHRNSTVMFYIIVVCLWVTYVTWTIILNYKKFNLRQISFSTTFVIMHSMEDY